MSATALLLVSAFLHASWNVLLRFAKDKATAPLAMLTVCFAASASWTLLVDRASSAPLDAIAWAVAAGIAEGGYVLSLGRAIRAAPIGVAYAVSRGGAMLLVWPLSVALLGERPRALSLLGAGAVCGGLVLASVSPAGATSSRTRLAWSFATAAFIAAYHLAYGRALAAGIHAPLAVTISIGVGVVLAHASLAKPMTPLRSLVEQPFILGVGGVLSAMSFLVFLEGLTRSGAGAALSLRNTSIGFTVVLSALLGERATKRQWLGVAVVAIGALMFIG